MQWIATWLPTAALSAMMLAMGMTLVPRDFRRVVEQPRAFAFGACGQIVLLPALAFATAWMLTLPRDLAIGLVLLAACPGGVTSNALSHYARGNTALSISLTALSSSLSFLTVPVVVGTAFIAFPRDAGEASVSLPALETALTILATTVLPMALGMAARYRNAELASRLSGPILGVSTSVLMLMFAALWVQVTMVSEDIGGLFARASLAAGVWTAALLAIGWLGARALRLPPAERRTVMLELTLQNFNLVLVIAMTILGQPRLTGMSIVYLPAMVVAGAGIVMWGRRADAIPCTAPAAREPLHVATHPRPSA
jgi:bile acid:Na+ symporter, BASS family